MAISQLYPNQRPTLNLNFARSKTLDSRITFSRGGCAGTYVGSNGLIKTAAVDEPRFDHDPVTGDCRGLLIEELRTNYNFYSNDFSNAHYTNVYNNLTETNTTAPDGSNDAISFGEGVASPMAINPAVSTQTFTSSTASVYVKVFGSRRYFAIREVKTSNNWVRAVFDCTGEGSFQTVEGDVVTRTGFTPYIKNVGNGWYRCSLNVTYSTAQQVGFYFNPSDTDTGGGVTNSGYGSATASPTAGSGFVLWGYQQEAGGFPTSLIPTSGSTCTRNADTAEITGTSFSSWYSQSEGTFVAEGQSFSTSNGLLTVWGTNTNDRMFLGGLSTSWQYQVRDNGTVQASLDNGSYDQTAFNKLAATYQANDFGLSANGRTTVTDTSGSLPTISRLQIAQLNGAFYSSHVSKISYYPTRLTDSQLQELTS
mgnify:CR=1 FL=1